MDHHHSTRKVEKHTKCCYNEIIKNNVQTFKADPFLKQQTQLFHEQTMKKEMKWFNFQLVQVPPRWNEKQTHIQITSNVNVFSLFYLPIFIFFYNIFYIFAFLPWVAPRCTYLTSEGTLFISQTRRLCEVSQTECISTDIMQTFQKHYRMKNITANSGWLVVSPRVLSR